MKLACNATLLLVLAVASCGPRCAAAAGRGLRGSGAWRGEGRRQLSSGGISWKCADRSYQSGSCFQYTTKDECDGGAYPADSYVDPDYDCEQTCDGLDSNGSYTKFVPCYWKSDGKGDGSGHCAADFTCEVSSANECKCAHGVAVTGSACTANGANICASCDGPSDDVDAEETTSYTLSSSTCVPTTTEWNTCTCSYGVAAVGSKCTTDGTEICASCDEPLSLFYPGESPGVSADEMWCR